METKNLTDALAHFQLQLKPIKKETDNPFFKSKYAGLDAVCSTIFETLGNYGLAVTQPGDFFDGKFVIRTTLRHTSGENVESLWPVLSKDNTAQGMASGSTYARRYALMAMVGASTTDDDDGAHASGTITPLKIEQKKSAPTLLDAPMPETQYAPPITGWDTSAYGSCPMPFGKTKGIPLNQHNRASIESAMQWAIEKGKFKEFVVEAQEYLKILDIKNETPNFNPNDELPF